MRVEHAVDAPLGDGADLCRGDGHEVGCEGERLAVEVAGRFDRAVLEHHRVIDCRSQLHRCGAARKLERVPRRAGDLRAAAHGVRVLHRVARMPVRRDDVRLAEQQSEVRRARDLARMWANVVQVRLERAVGAQETLDRHRRRDVGGAEENLRIGACKREHAEHSIGAVD